MQCLLPDLLSLIFNELLTQWMKGISTIQQKKPITGLYPLNNMRGIGKFCVRARVCACFKCLIGLRNTECGNLSPGGFKTAPHHGYGKGEGWKEIRIPIHSP